MYVYSKPLPRSPERNWHKTENARCANRTTRSENGNFLLTATVGENARRNNPIHVTRMIQDDFVSLQPVKKCIVNRKVTTSKQKVNWFEIKWIHVQQAKPLQFQYRCSHNELERWKTVDLVRKRGGITMTDGHKATNGNSDSKQSYV